MTKFNPDNKEKPTHDDLLAPAMKITDQADADQYKQAYIEFTRKHMDKEPNDDGQTAEDIVNSNLGFYAGYYDDDTRRRVEKLFHCKHPVFGAIEENGSPTPEQAFKMGQEYAKKK